MKKNNHNPTSVLPSLAELNDLVVHLAHLVRDTSEWESFNSTPKAMRGHLLALAPRKFTSEGDEKRAWSKIYALPAYKIFTRDPNFSTALGSFEKAVLPNSMQKARFLAEVAFHMYHYRMAVQHPDLLKQPTTRLRGQTVSAAHKLMKLTKKGARLYSLQDQTKLETLLSHLVRQMETKERVRDDDTRAERLFVEQLTGAFLTHFQQTLPTVLKSLAAVICYEPDDRNIEKIISKVSKEHQRQYRNALAKALLDY